MVSERKQVLVVEDDVKTSDIVRAYLEKDGYDVITAHDGLEGLSAARHYSPDLIVLDLLLPGASVLDVCQTLRNELSIPIIMLTALSTEQDKLRGPRPGGRRLRDQALQSPGTGRQSPRGAAPDR